MAKQAYVVSGRVGPTSGRPFRNVSSGAFSATVMSNDAYKRASAKANSAISQALRSPPSPPGKKK